MPEVFLAPSAQTDEQFEPFVCKAPAFAVALMEAEWCTMSSQVYAEMLSTQHDTAVGGVGKRERAVN